MKSLIDKLETNHTLSKEEFVQLILNHTPEDAQYLFERARCLRQKYFGNGVFLRGLIEVSSYCHNDCLYCGIRHSNATAERYRLTDEQILSCCAQGHALGFRTFVLQGGEDGKFSDERMVALIQTIKQQYPDCAVTLSLGERKRESYQKLFEAGADRYLLRHETFNQEHYSRLHPDGMSRDARLACLTSLKYAGYQTGTGIMVGSPYQTIDDIVEDLMYIQELKPEMIGIGPFIHHHGTPFAGMPDGSLDLTLKLISIFRLMRPYSLIPATTALATLSPDGRTKGILAGANVVMPNLTPAKRRGDYSLYEGKASTGAESAEGLAELKKELNAIGYDVIVHRGDYDKNYDRKCIM